MRPGIPWSKGHLEGVLSTLMVDVAVKLTGHLKVHNNQNVYITNILTMKKSVEAPVIF